MRGRRRFEQCTKLGMPTSAVWRKSPSQLSSQFGVRLNGTAKYPYSGDMDALPNNEALANRSHSKNRHAAGHVQLFGNSTPMRTATIQTMYCLATWTLCTLMWHVIKSKTVQKWQWHLWPRKTHKISTLEQWPGRNNLTLVQAQQCGAPWSHRSLESDHVSWWQHERRMHPRLNVSHDGQQQLQQQLHIQ